VADDVLGRRALGRATLERQLLLQPMLERRQRGFFGRTTAGVDPAALAAAARRLLAERPLTRPELGRLLAERWPDHEPGALAWSAQFLLPLIHPSPSGTWGWRGPTPCVLAESWLGRPLRGRASSPDGMVKRHLAAFGPAVLVDGAVVAIWRIARARGTATLEVDPLGGLSGSARAAVAGEGMRLLEFAAADADDRDVRFVAAGGD
jgi:hypothetical protein